MTNPKVWVGIGPYSLGRSSYIGEFSHIAQFTTIGNFCSIGNLCTLGAQNHRLDWLSSFPFEETTLSMPIQKTTIGSDVWIGCNAVVISGLEIGHGAVIGAGAVVTKNLPPYAIAAGNPAKVIRFRFGPELIKGLLETRWWDRTDEVVRELKHSDPKTCIEHLRGLGDESWHRG